MGEMNANVGSANTDRKREMGRHGLSAKNENREMLLDFCAISDLSPSSLTNSLLDITRQPD